MRYLCGSFLGGYDGSVVVETVGVPHGQASRRRAVVVDVGRPVLVNYCLLQLPYRNIGGRYVWRRDSGAL